MQWNYWRYQLVKRTVNVTKWQLSSNVSESVFWPKSLSESDAFAASSVVKDLRVKSDNIIFWKKLRLSLSPVLFDSRVDFYSIDWKPSTITFRQAKGKKAETIC